MYVMRRGPAAPEVTRLRGACERTGRPLEETAAQDQRELGARVADDLLDETGALTAPSASVRLPHAEARAPRALADRGAVIGPGPDLLRLTGEDPCDVIESLRARFREVVSGAQILKVPHMGFRLVGDVRPKAGA